MRSFATSFLLLTIVCGCGSSDSSDPTSTPEIDGGAPGEDASTGTDSSTDSSDNDAQADTMDDVQGDAFEDAPLAANPLEYWHAGSRLVPMFRVTTSEDGASITAFDTWHDTLLDIECSFEITGTKVPCGPQASTVETVSKHFSDSNCTTPALRTWVGQGNPAPQYVKRKVNCTPVYYSTGSHLSQVYETYNGNCTVYTPQDGYYFFTENSIEELSNLALVTATNNNALDVGTDDYTPGSRLVASVTLMLGDDGSESRTFSHGFIDKQLSRFCINRTIVKDNSRRCLPRMRVPDERGSYYLDDACTDLAAEVYNNYDFPTDPCVTTDPMLALDIARQSYDGDGCYVGVSTFEWPQGVTGEPSAYSLDNNNQCSATPYTPGGSYRYFSVADLFGKPLPPSTYAHLDWTLIDAPAPNASGSRIITKTRHYSGADGVSVDSSWTSFFDSSLDVNCSSYNTSDGKIRCLPEAGHGRIVFQDDACTQAVFVFSKPNPCRAYQYILIGDYNDTIDVYAMPEPPYADAGVLYSFEYGACYGANYGSTYAILTTIPDKLPLSTFAEMTRTIVQQ